MMPELLEVKYKLCPDTLDGLAVLFRIGNDFEIAAYREGVVIQGQSPTFTGDTFGESLKMLIHWAYLAHVNIQKGEADKTQADVEIQQGMAHHYGMKLTEAK